MEVPAAIWRKQRLGELDVSEARELVRAFETDYHGQEAQEPRLAIISLDIQVLREAARLAAVHALRAYDAVQLASAMAARGAEESCSTFVAFDSVLVGAAAAEGFETITSSEGPAASG